MSRLPKHVPCRADFDWHLTRRRRLCRRIAACRQHDDAPEILEKIRHQAPQATVVAIGTPMQLAAQAADADGWLIACHAGMHRPTGPDPFQS